MITPMAPSAPSLVAGSSGSARPQLWFTCKRLTWYRLLRHLKKFRDRHYPRPVVLEYDLSGQAANDQIRALIERPAPCMIARFGGTEMSAIQNYLGVQKPGRLFQRVRRYLRGESGPWWWDDRTIRSMIRLSGFFPSDPEHLERFSIMALEDSKQLDLLGSWLPDEVRFPYAVRPCRVPLMDLEPYRHANPWSEALAGRKVLVIHPFERTIASQYANRKALFRDPRVLPAFDLVTFPAVQSLAGDCPRFKDWFAALEWMEQGIAALDFEVAIIGAGAYGMALAAFIKRDLGRKAIHLGGASQILFGIRGKRWDDIPEYAQDLYNEAWVRPSLEEKPVAAERVEGACYW
jgi:hypothetical protein